MNRKEIEEAVARISKELGVEIHVVAPRDRSLRDTIPGVMESTSHRRWTVFRDQESGNEFVFSDLYHPHDRDDPAVTACEDGARVKMGLERMRELTLDCSDQEAPALSHVQARMGVEFLMGDGTIERQDFEVMILGGPDYEAEAAKQLWGGQHGTA